MKGAERRFLRRGGQGRRLHPAARAVLYAAASQQRRIVWRTYPVRSPIPAACMAKRSGSTAAPTRSTATWRGPASPDAIPASSSSMRRSGWSSISATLPGALPISATTRWRPISIPARAVRDLEAAAAYLRGLPAATQKVGAIGFCSGGRHTLLFACSSDKLDAAIDCWGGFIHRATPDAETTPARPRPVLDLIDRLGCPLFAAFGEEDQNPSVALAEELRSRAQKAGKEVTIKIYRGAGHAFLADYRPSYREKPAFELWSDIVAFFDKHLKS